MGKERREGKKREERKGKEGGKMGQEERTKETKGN